MLNLSRRSTGSDELREFAERAGHHVDDLPLPLVGSCSMMTEDGDTFIGIDTAPCPEDLLRVRLAHEIGHCERGAFYNIYAADDVRGKHERRADEWAIRHLIPRRAFNRAVRQGFTEPYQIAEEFCVTVDFAVKAVRLYCGIV